MNVTVPYTCLVDSEQYHSMVTLLYIIWSTSLPIMLWTATCYACFWKDKHTLYVLCATLITAMWTVTVKELTRVERPRPYCTTISYWGHSMPSLYAAISVFLATYYITQFILHARGEWQRSVFIIRISTILIYTGGVCYTRVALYFARGEDILVGSLLGGAAAVAFMFLLKRQKLAATYKATLKTD